MREIYPPFTPDYRFTGPTTAISCEVEWDKEELFYHAKSSNGFHGTGTTEHEAALNCFTAWMTLQKGWYDKNSVA